MELGEIFVLPEDNNLILYAPLDHAILRVRPEIIPVLQRLKKDEINEEDKPILDELKKLGLLIDKSKIHRLSEKKDYLPTSVILIPTYNCNLRCVYCYSHGGEDVNRQMPFEVAKTAIDTIVRNATQIKFKSVSLGFHGGGEPLLEENEDLVKNAIRYFKSQCIIRNLKPNISSATNGVMKSQTLEWVVQEFNHLNISLDGPEDIQNRQRPKVGNRHSYNEVLATIQYLESKDFSYGLRATITKESVQRLPEIVRFFHSVSKKASFQLEPLFECGRCQTSKEKAPDPDQFITGFLKAQEYARENKIKLTYSGSRLGTVTSTFCGACGNNFFITPDGNVTTCLEVSRLNDSASDIFFIGGYDPELRTFRLNHDRIDNLSTRTIDNLPHCQGCFAKYNCGGDCPVKTYHENESMFDTSKNSRCKINRKLLYKDIQSALDKPSKSAF